MIAYEIIYDEKQTRVIGSKEIDIDTLQIVKVGDKKGWIQYGDDPARKRVFYEHQIILIPKLYKEMLDAWMN